MPMMRPLLGDDFIDISVEEREKENNNIKVFPNPTSGTIKIQFDSHEQIPIQIYNTSGQLIINKSISDSEIIELSSFGKGLYILKIQDKTKKIIVL
jgi:hypothetical protein